MSVCFNCLVVDQLAASVVGMIQWLHNILHISTRISASGDKVSSEPAKWSPSPPRMGRGLGEVSNSFSTAKLDRKPSCGAFYIDLNAWIRKAEFLRQAGVTKEQLNAFSGVSLFRDGIRVLPYGDE